MLVGSWEKGRGPFQALLSTSQDQEKDYLDGTWGRGRSQKWVLSVLLQGPGYQALGWVKKVQGCGAGTLCLRELQGRDKGVLTLGSSCLCGHMADKGVSAKDRGRRLGGDLGKPGAIVAVIRALTPAQLELRLLSSYL